MSAIAQKFSCSKKVLFGTIHLYNKTKKFETPARKSRARKHTTAGDRIICRTSKRNPLLSSRSINTTQHKWCENLRRNPDWRVIMANFVCMYVMELYSFESMPVNYIFQYDNEPKHTSRSVKCWLSGQNIDILDWPPKVPISNQLNIYGHLLK